MWYQGDILVAHYAVIPRVFRYKNETILGSMSLNTATAPNHQGKGLFKKLATKTYELASNNNIKFVCGIANQNSIYAFEKSLGFNKIGSVELALLGGEKNKTVNYLELDKDIEWLQWRLKNPSNNYSLIERKNKLIISCKIKNINFNLFEGEISETYSKLLKQKKKIFHFKPYFGKGIKPTLNFPQRLRPSPWHVIVKSLNSEITPELLSSIYFDGLSMDTF